MTTLVKFKDHQLAKLVNDLRDVAKDYHDHQSLRERIATVVRHHLDGEIYLQRTDK